VFPAVASAPLFLHSFFANFFPHRFNFSLPPPTAPRPQRMEGVERNNFFASSLAITPKEVIFAYKKEGICKFVPP